MLLLAASACAQKLHKLDDESVADVMDGPLDALIMFESSWCEACKMLHPHLGKLQELVNGAEKMPLPLFVGSIDAERWSTLASLHGVTEYPSLLYFPAKRRDEPQTFPGTDMQALLKWVGVQARRGVFADIHDLPKWPADMDSQGQAEPAALAALECGGAPPGLLVGGELSGLMPRLKPAEEGGPRSRDEVAAAGVARWDLPSRRWAALGALGGRVMALHVNGSAEARLDGSLNVSFNGVEGPSLWGCEGSTAQQNCRAAASSLHPRIA